MTTVIKVENLSKAYRLGLIGGKTLREDLNRWWARVRRKPDPTLKIGQADHGNIEGETIWALRDVSFEVQQGEVLGIIGRNGAGKSTLLKIISRITAPTSGQIKIKGRVGSLLEVGTGFHPELTGRENIYLNGVILGMKRAEIDRKFDEIVDFSGVEQFIDTPVKRYSSGMYVRLAFAVAAHLDPEILVVDEVLAVGDVAFQKKCLGKMGDVAKEGRTVLFVSHNMAAVRNLCGSAMLLEEGHLKCNGSTDSVIGDYLQALVPLKSSNDPYLARSDDLDVTLKRVDLLNDKGEIVPAMQTGLPNVIRLCLETKTHHNNLFVSITVNTPEDIRICAFHMIVAGFYCDLDTPGAYVHCIVPKVPFFPGHYRLNIKVAVGGEVAFYLPHAVEITVESGDFFGTGRLPAKSWGGACMVAHSWEAVRLDQVL